ncbi:hybrid sensor histidine kinase/response regulator [Variovorax sp. PBL-E5]|uniref:hybrid sensor histidine kinase/response regulator n=1 Tax=Variovorax sp. PBL-E5 TaxID=434014 RepID=UPI001315CC89|nr:hybrid sensor histidine kinase/response regulator [Variovorax sp. PBL-E5]VTU39406.1 Aerobic respiration control sensor protein ArcB [Variovorax sp. PBL-E5]
MRLALPSGRNVVIAALVVVVISFIAVACWISHLDKVIVRTKGPYEGYYWTVAQYEMAYLRMREATEILALHGDIDDDELSKRVDVLMSKALILTGDSELTTFFESIPGFEAGKEKIVAFHRRVNPMLDSIDGLRARADDLLQEFSDIEGTILALANEVRMEEMEASSTALESLLKQRQLLWIAIWIDFGLMLVCVLCVSFSWSRFRKVTARERALEAEHIAVQAKTQFLSMVSHELRSPLQSIISALDVLEESQQALPEQASVTRRIRRSADELAVHLRDLLTLARGQTGRIELRPEVFEASALVREMVQDATEAAEAKGLELTVETPSDPIFAVADGARIGQLLQNLIDNAVKYTNQGRVAVTLLPFDTSKAALRLRVADTGPGLPANAAGTVTQGLEPEPHQPGRGRGIGLAVVRALLQQLGGSIQISETKGGGTTVDLIIPAVVAEDRAPVEGSGERRLLIVGDGSERMEEMVHACAALALRCDTAGSTAVALNLLAAHCYGTVLIDLEMLSSSGAELVAKVRACSLNGHVRLVAMASGRAWKSELGAFDTVLEKPVRREQIAALTQPKKILPAQRK